MPIDDPRFGKLFRCPGNHPDRDHERREKLRRLSNLHVFADKTFEAFKVEMPSLTPSQRQSLDYAFRVALGYSQKPDGWLLLEGSYGSGKTHLAAAIGNARLEHEDIVLFITTPDLLDHLRGTYGPSSETAYDDMFDRIRNAPLLILDDLGAENPSGWAQEKLFQLLNHRYSRRLSTVITTNADLDTIDARIRSRLLDENLIHRVKLAVPDYRSAVENQREQLSSLSLYTHMTFSTFDSQTRLKPHEQQNLEFAVGAVWEYAQAMQGWLVLLGDFYGCGKTHLAASVAQYQQERGTTVIFTTVPDLLDYLRVTYNPGAPVSFDQRFNTFRNAPLLVLDNLGMESATAWAKEKLFQILDYRYVTARPTVITTSKRLEDLDQRISSRLVDERICRIIRIKAPDYASRIRA